MLKADDYVHLYKSSTWSINNYIENLIFSMEPVTKFGTTTSCLLSGAVAHFEIRQVVF